MLFTGNHKSKATKEAKVKQIQRNKQKMVNNWFEHLQQNKQGCLPEVVLR